MHKQEKQGKGSFIKGALWIAGGGFVAKLLGALYRIPLTNLIGGYGIGLYQMVYPVYCILLTVSATGIPSSIAKLTAEKIARGEEDRSLLKLSLKLFLWIGAAGTLIMVAIAPILAKAQNSPITSGYFALAPSVFFVSAISVFRGWFQGHNQMRPTALSEMLEQLIKVGFGLLFAYLFRGDITRAVTFLLLAVSISELCSLLLMIFLFRRVPAPEKQQKFGKKVGAKSILKLSIPVTFSSILLPLSAFLDSVLVPRFLGIYEPNAVALYGLFAGGAVTLISLPVSICYGIAAAAVPSVAAESGKPADQTPKPRKKIFFALGITLIVALPSAIALYLFAQPAVSIVFRGLSGEESATLVRLVKIYAISALTLSCVQTLAACLTAQGKPQYAALSMLIAVTVKTVAYTILIRNPSLSIDGLAHATNLCYAVAFALDFLFNLRVSKRKKAAV